MLKALLKLANEDELKLPDFTVQAHPCLNENRQTVDWGLNSLHIPELWKETKGSGVKVAILDTGMDLEHDDLYRQCVKYKNFTNKETDNVSDYIGHGTHCAGVVAAMDNQFGVVGVAPSAELYIAKVLDDSGRGRITWIVNGIHWAVDQGVHIISMSLGGPTSDPRMAEAVQYAIDNDVIVIAAAGNSGEGENTVGFPGAYPDVITVGAINGAMERAYFSSTGPSLEIMGPGRDVLSTMPGNKYATMSGTSMATPFIAGVAALILASDRKRGHDLKDYGDNPHFNAAVYMSEVLTGYADDIEENGFDPSTGWGIVNPAKSVHHK